MGPEARKRKSQKPQKSPGVLVAEQIRASRRRNRGGKGMDLVTVVVDDLALRYIVCPHCRKGFKGGELAFVSCTKREAMHAKCLAKLAESLVNNVVSVEAEELELTRRRILEEGLF